MAKTFGQKPSDLALLDDSISDVGRFFFNRGVAAFGNAVHERMSVIGRESSPVLARALREREWQRIMGGDPDDTSAFAEPDPTSMSAHARVIGADDMELDDEEFDIVDDSWSDPYGADGESGWVSSAELFGGDYA